MHVKIDISENVRFVEKDSVLGVATDDQSYKKNVCLYPRVKKRIHQYPSKVDKVHSILIYYLIKDELHLYSSIQICNDINKNKLINNLRKLFKDNPHWSKLEKSRCISVLSVKKAYVHQYVNRVRKGKEDKGTELNLDIMKNYLRKFSDEEEQNRKET